MTDEVPEIVRVPVTVLVPVPEKVVAVRMIVLSVTDTTPDIVRVPLTVPVQVRRQGGVDTERDVGGGQGTRDRAGPVGDAVQSPETCVAMTLSLMSVAVEVHEIVPVPAVFLVPLLDTVLAG